METARSPTRSRSPTRQAVQGIAAHHEEPADLDIPTVIRNFERSNIASIFARRAEQTIDLVLLLLQLLMQPLTRAKIEMRILSLPDRPSPYPDCRKNRKRRAKSTQKQKRPPGGRPFFNRV